MIIIWFLLWLAPLTLLIHELGHSIGAYIVGSEKIQLFIGVGKRLLSFPVGKISIHIHSFYMLGGHTVSERDPYYSKTEQVVIALLGPLLNGLVGILLNLLLHTNRSEVLLTFILFNLWLCIINLIPYRIGSKSSDGYLIMKTLLSKKNRNESN